MGLCKNVLSLIFLTCCVCPQKTLAVSQEGNMSQLLSLRQKYTKGIWNFKHTLIRAFFKVIKYSKVRSYFSAKKGIFVQMKLLWQGYDPDILPKKLQQIFRKQNLKILSQTLGKARRGAQWKLIFCVEGLNSKLRWKAQNSDFDWGPLHDEIWLLK